MTSQDWQVKSQSHEWLVKSDWTRLSSQEWHVECGMSTVACQEWLVMTSYDQLRFSNLHMLPDTESLKLANPC